MKPLRVISTIEHKHEGLPRFVCIPMKYIEPWKLAGTTTVELSINGVDVGRRSLKRWDDRNCWWMDLSNEVCRKADIETGDRVELVLTIGSEELPAELAMLIKKNPIARQRWETLTPGQQRMLRENILSAKQSATRARRAARELGVD
ncbi:MAG TPA: YdeI/OmpD-associated family protein [Pyrinomonadaceae bacterium]|nr:YdeI/OmpD-associated family protein [Pyrinomonadaceae bacterium]